MPDDSRGCPACLGLHQPYGTYPLDQPLNDLDIAYLSSRLSLNGKQDEVSACQKQTAGQPGPAINYR